MERFSSMMPQPDAGQTIPPQTVTSQQAASAVEPVIISHRVDPSPDPAVASAGLEDVHRDSDGESEAPPPSFLDTVNSVYKFLPAEVCPKMDLPPPRVTSLFESTSTPELTIEMPKLPFSPTVGLLVKEIEGHLSMTGEGRVHMYPRGLFVGWAHRSFTRHITPVGP